MALYTPEYQPTGEEIAVINTSKGPIRVQLAGNDAPIHVGNFVELAQKGFYDGLKFHRYVPASSSRAAAPTPARRPPSRWPPAALPGMAPFGTGNPGYSIKEEFTTNPNNSHEDGALAMARSMDPNSAGSQFYLCLGPQHNLDSGYTVFGQTIEGKDVIGQLRARRCHRVRRHRERRRVSTAPREGSAPAVRAVSPHRRAALAAPPNVE